MTPFVNLVLSYFRVFFYAYIWKLPFIRWYFWSLLQLSLSKYLDWESFKISSISFMFKGWENTLSLPVAVTIFKTVSFFGMVIETGYSKNLILVLLIFTVGSTVFTASTKRTFWILRRGPNIVRHLGCSSDIICCGIK